MSENPPYLPETAPFTSEQRAWLNGFLAGVFGSAPGSAGGIAPALGQASAASLLNAVVLYGSQTGTAEALAKQFAKAAKPRGLDAKIFGMERHSDIDWSKQSRLLILTSTYGEGEMPDNAKGFWDHLAGDGAPDLSHLEFSVLALGDTNYEKFCQAGRDFDRRIEELGARRLHDRVECDVEYDEPFAKWSKGVLDRVTSAEGQNGSVGSGIAASESPAFSKKNPYPTRLLANLKLTPDDADKETRHYEIALDALTYEVGDALGIFPANCGALVDEVISALGADPETPVTPSDGGTMPLRAALLTEYDITKPNKQLIARVSELAPESELAGVHADPAALKQFFWGREVIDLLHLLPPASIAPAEFVTLLRKMAPRLYSISSSPKSHPGEVHLTVASVRYDGHGRSRKGVCSTFLADRCGSDTDVRVFVQPSHGFRLPSDLTKPVIMVGPGTGVAPFRAFLEEREATASPGKNWLFFGERNEASGYFYREQFARMQTDGVLTHLTTAFSRDQEAKIYVQDRMREHGAELWQWLQDGAHFYVCGDASRMAKDVDTALREICTTHGGLDESATAAFMDRLKAEKRYQRDVY